MAEIKLQGKLTIGTGPAGKDGTMTFEDLTEDQKATLKGDKGDTGAQGPIGPQGPQGIVGPRGNRGEQGIQGIPGPVGPMGPKGKFEELTPEEKQQLIGPEGPKGPKGDKGADGDRGERGEKGERGPVGPAGANGKDADMSVVDTKIQEALKDFKPTGGGGGSSEGTPFIMPMIGPGMFRMCGAINLGSASNTHYTDIYKLTANQRCVMVMPIPVKPGTKLKVTGYYKWKFAFHCYDANGKNVYDSTWNTSPSKPGWSGENTFTVPSDKEYRIAFLYCGTDSIGTIRMEDLERLCGGHDQANNALTVRFVD